MKLRLVLGIALALLMLPASTLAATPDNQTARQRAHQIEVGGSFADNDFCGTGQTVEVKTRAVLNFYRGQRARHSTGYARSVFVNPANGAQVAMKSVGKLSLHRVAEDTGFAVIASLRGQPALIKTGKGSDSTFRSRDPGYVVFVNHFSSEWKYLGSEVAQRDLDPETNRAFKRLCRIATNALGL